MLTSRVGKSTGFSLTGAYTLTGPGVEACRSPPAQTVYFLMPLTLVTDHTDFSYPKAFTSDMGIPVLSLPEITNVVREWWVSVGLGSSGHAQRSGILHAGPILFSSFCMPVLYSGIYLAQFGPLAPTSGCSTMHLTSSNSCSRTAMAPITHCSSFST